MMVERAGQDAKRKIITDDDDFLAQKNTRLKILDGFQTISSIWLEDDGLFVGRTSGKRTCIFSDQIDFTVPLILSYPTRKLCIWSNRWRVLKNNDGTWSQWLFGLTTHFSLQMICYQPATRSVVLLYITILVNKLSIGMLLNLPLPFSAIFYRSREVMIII